MSPRIITEIHPYEDTQRVSIYRDNDDNDVIDIPTKNLIKKLYEIYNRENACQLTLLGSKHFNKGVENELRKISTNLKIYVL